MLTNIAYFQAVLCKFVLKGLHLIGQTELIITIYLIRNNVGARQLNVSDYVSQTMKEAKRQTRYARMDKEQRLTKK